MSVVAVVLGTGGIQAQADSVRPDSSLLLRALQERARSRPAPAPAANRARAIVAAVGSAKTPAARADQARLLLREIGRATGRDLPVVRAAITDLRARAGAVEALVSAYRATPASEFEHRLLAIQVLGELQMTSALGPLLTIVDGKLPERDSLPRTGLTPRDRETILQGAAVQSVGFLRRPNGATDTTALRAVERIARDHPSRYVRVTAIDTYMWNNADSPAAAQRLRAVLPTDYHAYIDRPRFGRGADAEAFAALLRQWRERWSR